MRLTVSRAIALALIAGLLPGCERTATDAEEAASKGGTSGQTPQGAASGHTKEGSKDRGQMPR
jgi:hypothetical protein